MSQFVAIEAEADAGTLEQESIELLEAAFEGWQPAAGNLEYWLIRAFSRIGASIFDQATLLSTGAFKRFGESVVSVPPIQAAPATLESNWTMVDNAGYTVPAGTQVNVEKDGETSLGFRTTEAVEIAPGSTTATILLEAVVPGEAGNDLTADPALSDALAYVKDKGIESLGVSANGVDEEEEDNYLNRLVETLQLLSLNLIKGRDFEIDARAVAGIARCKTIESYDAEAEEEKPLAVSDFPADADGQPMSAEVKAELKARQEAKVPDGALVFVDDPTYTPIKVKTQFKVLTGFDSATVVAAVKTRLEEYLAAKNWGLPTQGDASTSSGWENKTAVYRFELVSEVDRVGGVDRVTLLELAKGAGALGTADLSLTGKVTLTESGVLTVEAV